MTYPSLAVLLGRPQAELYVIVFEQALQYSVSNECQFLQYVSKLTNQMCFAGLCGVLPMTT